MRVCPICFLPQCNHKRQYVEIDDDIVDTIKILNDKGYKTEYCCAGHIDLPIIYIKFNSEAVVRGESKLPETLPNDKWVCYPRHIENHHYVWSKKLSLYNGDAMYYIISKRRGVKYKLAELEKQRKELYEWAKELK